MSLQLRDALGDELAGLGTSASVGPEGEPYVLELGDQARRDRADRVTRKLIDELEGGGIDRTAIVKAIAGELQKTIGVCGDRRDRLARGVLDAALAELVKRTR